MVIAIIAILASLLLPALKAAKAKAGSITCMTNTKQLMVAWLMYADENENRLVNNHGFPQVLAERNSWVNNVMDWSHASDNYRLDLIRESLLSPYLSASVKVLKCPSDKAVSNVQRDAGITKRVRSYSMNAAMGEPGWQNQAAAGFAQYITLADLREPANRYVLLDEHPDSINDGWYLPFNGPGGGVWIDLPASYHNGAAGFSFADGHSEIHKWDHGRTRSARHEPGGCSAVEPIYKKETTKDYLWVSERMFEPIFIKPGRRPGRRPVGS